MKVKVVYFLKPIGLVGPIKIGCAYDAAARLIAFSRQSALPLELLGTVLGTPSDEAFLHGCFADSHSHGEWFFPSARLLRELPRILRDGIPYARANLSRIGVTRNWAHSDETRTRMSIAHRQRIARLQQKASQ